MWLLWILGTVAGVAVALGGCAGIMLLWIWVEEWAYRRRWSGPVKKPDTERWF